MLRKCADNMDLMSEHFYCGENPKDLVAHVREIPDEIRRIADAHRDYRKRLDSLQGKDIRIAMDEWNYWYGAEPYGQIGCPFHLKDALGIAAGLHEYARQSDIVFMANYAQTVNVIGCIKTSKTAACFDTTGLVLKLYRQHFGVTPVAVESPRAVGRGGRLDRRSQGADDRHRQSDDEAGRALIGYRRGDAQGRRGRLADRRQRSDGPQRPGQGAAGEDREIAAPAARTPGRQGWRARRR